MVEANTEQQDNSEVKEELPQSTQRACATPDCSKPAAMQCPTCIKLGLEPTYFCSQTCFASFWKFHKLAHSKPKDGSASQSSIYTGPLRPYPYSFKGKRNVPEEIKKPDYATTGQPNQHFQTLANR